MIELPVTDVEFALSKVFATSAAFVATLISVIDAKLKNSMNILSLRLESQSNHLLLFNVNMQAK